MRESARDKRLSSVVRVHLVLPPNGGVAQLGEHLPCKQGVMGSNPIISTKEMIEISVTSIIASIRSATVH